MHPPTAQMIKHYSTLFRVTERELQEAASANLWAKYFDLASFNKLDISVVTGAVISALF
jgi:hypothetical protein